MARVFGGLESDLTMVFALFDAEEYGLWGSEYYAVEAASRGDDIEYMLNLDMVAHYQNYGEANLYYGPETGYSTLLQSLSEPVAGITSYFEGSSSGSDHFYFIQYGYEATFFQERNFSTVYHSPQDSTSYLNFEYFTRMTKAALATLFVIDNGVMFSGDITAGNRPLSVNFNSWTMDPPTSWAWDFGDGGTASVALPSHTYDSRGVYTVSVDVVANGANRGLQRSNYIAVLDDTLSGDEAAAAAQSVVEVTVNASHIVPIRQFEIPVEITGDLPLTYQSFSTVGCRTENFSSQSVIHLDPFNNRFTIRLANGLGEEYNVPAGSGPILKLYYYNSETAPSGHSSQIIFDGYSSHMPVFSGPVVTYNPTTTVPAVVLSGCCENYRGNVNGDVLDEIDIADLTFLVSYMFKSGPIPPCEAEGNINGIGDIDIADVTYLVSFMFKSGPPPATCQ
jgi:PKD repeat protein